MDALYKYEYKDYTNGRYRKRRRTIRVNAESTLQQIHDACVFDLKTIYSRSEYHDHIRLQNYWMIALEGETCNTESD